MKNVYYTLLAILGAIVIISGINYLFPVGQERQGAVYDPQQNNRQLSAPTNGAAATSTGGSLAIGTYYFKLTSVDYAGGQTNPSSEFTCVVGVTNSACNVTFTPTTGALYNYLWIATTTGVYYGYNASATSTTHVKVTTGLTAGTLPQRNTAYLFNSGFDDGTSYLQAYVTADSLIKSGPTFVHSITYSPTDAAATAGTIAVLDAVANAATAGVNAATSTLYGVPAAAIIPNTIILDQVFDTGLYVDFTTTNDINVNISYK